MMLSGIGLFKGIMAKMEWLDQNQRIVSTNIANSDTPGYQAQSLKEADFASMMKSSEVGSGTKLAMAKPEEGEVVSGADGSSGPAKSHLSKIKYEASPDNNGVVIEEQLFKANKNSMDYQLATDLYRRNAGMLRMVLQGANR